MSDDELKEFIAKSTAYLSSRIEQSRQTFGVGKFERFDYDLTANRFWWSDKDVPKVEAQPIPIGSVSTVTNTWLWSWANPSLQSLNLNEMQQIRTFGIEHNIRKLIDEKWPAEEIDGWEMTALSARLLEAEAAYRSPTKNGFLFLLLTKLKMV